MDIHTRFSIGDEVVAVVGPYAGEFTVSSVHVSISTPGKDRYITKETYGLTNGKGDFITMDGDYVYGGRQELLDRIFTKT